MLPNALIRAGAMAASFVALGTAVAQSFSLEDRTLDEIRATAPARSPERGNVRLYELKAPLTASAVNPALPLDPRHSLFVSDLKSTEGITFDEVMSQLVAQSGDTHLTKLNLYRQWFDANSIQPGLGRGPHCDDETLSSNPNDPNLQAVANLNGFSYRCPRLEGELAFTDPFSNPKGSAGYTAIALVNRFDLVDDVRHPRDCGEYRIVFARNSGKTDPADRTLINFEAVVPNPHPRQPGLHGCASIVNFWHGLSDPKMSAEERGNRLHEFYFKGDLGNGEKLSRPVVHIENYTFGAGQIRTNQFHNHAGPVPADWTLREFKTLRANGSLQIVPDSVKTNPGSALFDPESTDARVAILESDLASQIMDFASVASSDDPNGTINSIGAGFKITGEGIDAFESDEKDGDAANSQITRRFNSTSELGKVIQAALNNQPSDSPIKALTADNIVHRLQTQTCAGCHHFSAGDDLGGGVTWPDTLGAARGGAQGFTQVTERETEIAADGEERWKVSNVVLTLLTHRVAFMKKALSLPQ